MVRIAFGEDARGQRVRREHDVVSGAAHARGEHVDERLEVVPALDEAELRAVAQRFLELRAIAGDRQARVVRRENEPDDGDPYEQQLHQTCRLVADRAALADWSFSYQSESPTGEPWLGPDILDHLDALDAQGVSDVLVCPVGFVSDHLEIRWDIDVEAQERAGELGMTLRRIEMPNADHEFVRALAALVQGALAARVAS